MDQAEQKRRDWLTGLMQQLLDSSDNKISICARKLNVSPQTVRNWNSDPSRQTDPLGLSGEYLFAIARATETPVLDFLESYARACGEIPEESDEDPGAAKKKASDALLYLERFIHGGPHKMALDQQFLSRFLQRLFQKHGLDWRFEGDRRRFAESVGKLGEPSNPWSEEDMWAPGGKLYALIAGTEQPARSDVGRLARCVEALTRTECMPDDIVRISNGDDPHRWLSANCNCIKSGNGV